MTPIGPIARAPRCFARLRPVLVVLMLATDAGGVIGGAPSAAASTLGGPAATVCDPPPTMPTGQPLDPDTRRRLFREPLPAAELWNPPGPKRVGLQVGHWLIEQAPSELRWLQGGAVGGGKQEWEVNLDIARRTHVLLEAAGVEVDILPATVPVRYRAHAFVSIHADGDPAGRGQGFKVARPAISAIPADDDRLVAAMNERYATATGLPRDDGNITIRMRYYYAFNSRRYCHAVAPGVPQLIVETGFLTSASDRALLLGAPDRAARGIAEGILAFLNGSPRP
jgi:N-acetylmuramoyl-L-alanine amidase